jgi:uncharacterized protein (TIGR02679 family)
MSLPSAQVHLPTVARAWLAQPELARLWDKVHERLQRNGIAIRGHVQIPDTTHAEREALSLLMGRVYSAAGVSIALADLDGRLQASAAERGLVDVVTELRGKLVNRPAVRSARQAGRQQVWTAAEQAMRDTRLADLPWAPDWLDEIRRGGAVSRLESDRAALLVIQAITVLARLHVRVGEAASAWRPAVGSRGELAEHVTGTAHGLDDDTVLARLVLRGIALSRGTELPGDARGRRELWEATGVATDQVSSTVLTYGLTPLGDGWPARLLRERSLAGAETHLTMRDLRRIEWRLAEGMEIFVCENPRVIEAAMDAACQGPLVCTAGNPITTVLALLDALTSAGAQLAYRGDFDWPGVAMANRIIRQYGARPWRMSAIDYEEHVRIARGRGTPLQPLSGAPVDAEWDPELAPAMQSVGVGVQEESALELLLADLGRPRRLPGQARAMGPGCQPGPIPGSPATGRAHPVRTAAGRSGCRA